MDGLAFDILRCACPAPATCKAAGVHACMQVAPLWFAAQYTFNLSLSETTVTSNTILASTSSLFTYGLSCALLLETFLLPKLAFIFLCMAGEPRSFSHHRAHSRHAQSCHAGKAAAVRLRLSPACSSAGYLKVHHAAAGTALVTFGDAKQTDSGQHNSVGGDLLVLLSGLCYAAYTVSLRHPSLHTVCFCSLAFSSSSISSASCEVC